MPKFYYSVKDAEDVRQSGTLEAATREEALTRLRDRFPLVLRLDPVGSSTALTTRRVTREDVLAFTQQMAAMLGSGISFGAAMDILLLERVHRPPMRRVLVDVAASVGDGRPFAEALRDHQSEFGELYIRLVEAGESSANLPAVLKRLADHIQKVMRFRMELLAAVLYPCLVLTFGVVVSIAMLAYGAPVVSELYTSAGLQLPWASRLFIGFGNLLARVWPFLLLFGVGGLAFMPQLLKSPAVQRTLITVGPFKEILLEAAVARCTRTLATLYSSGVPVLQSLEMTARGAGNELMKALFLRVKARVAAGSNLSEPLLASPLFPPMAAGMVAAGEAAGNLAVMLDHVADHYETRLDFALRAFSKTAEPFLVVAVGVLVGVVVVALGLPFMNLVSILV